MALPAAIPVRYTEEEAGYVSFRPVVRQTFRLHELLDMVLSVTGKEPERVRQILRAGTVVFHFYRYSWQGFEVDDADLQALLAEFPDSDPARPFHAEACTKLFLVGEPASSPRHFSVEVTRAAASRRRFLRRRSFWNAALAAAAAGPLVYDGYSYMHHADLFRLALTPATQAQLAADSVSLAPRNLRRQLAAVSDASHLIFACSRT